MYSTRMRVPYRGTAGTQCTHNTRNRHNNVIMIISLKTRIGIYRTSTRYKNHDGLSRVSFS